MTVHFTPRLLELLTPFAGDGTKPHFPGARRMKLADKNRRKVTQDGWIVAP